MTTPPNRLVPAFFVYSWVEMVGDVMGYSDESDSNPAYRGRCRCLLPAVSIRTGGLGDGDCCLAVDYNNEVVEQERGQLPEDMK